MVGSNPLMAKLGKALMRKTREKRADRYYEYIDDLVKMMEQQRDHYEKSPRRAAAKKNILSKLRYSTQGG